MAASNGSLIIECGARLHFGLWAWGDVHARQFGGVGMMIDRPWLVVRFAASDHFEPGEKLGERVQKFAARCVAHWKLTSLPPVRIEVLEHPPQHAGFGLGTQLGMAIARGMAESLDGEQLSPTELAIAAGRGSRSAIGTHGFELGGLLIDAGKREGDTVGMLEQRIAVPSEWRIVLVTPNKGSGMAGDAERSAFANLPPVPEEITRRLQDLATETIAPACAAADFDTFARGIYEYGHAAGLCFAAVQGGAYASVGVTRVVELLRSLGVAGVGQSSWGPTVFAMARDESQAAEIRAQLLETLSSDDYTITIAAAKNDGARVNCNT